MCHTKADTSLRFLPHAGRDTGRNQSRTDELLRQLDRREQERGAESARIAELLAELREEQPKLHKAAAEEKEQRESRSCHGLMEQGSEQCVIA